MRARVTLRAALVAPLAGTVVGLLQATSVFATDTASTMTTDTRATASSPTTSTLDPGELARARAWDLTEAEWSRYRSLLQGIRGSVSPPTLSPVEVLGIHARDETERRHYAERWAVLMREDVDRILAFQRAYDEAGRRLFGAEPLIDPARLPPAEEGSAALAPGDRVLLFTRPDCAPCDALLERLLRRLDTLAGLDIYLAEVKAGDERAVRDWATRHGIEPERVKRRQVTLNFAAGTLAELGHDRGPLPYVLRRRGPDLSPLSPGQL